MVKIYYSLVKRGAKTIEQVPTKLRKEVQALLEADTKE